MRRLAPIAPAALAAALVIAWPSAALRLAQAPACPVLPPDNPWNQRVDALPAASGSDRIVRGIGLDDYLHPDFGSGTYTGGPIGIPYKVVSKRQRRVRVRFTYADESDRVRYPIPRNVPIEGGRRSTGDRHVILVDRDRCRLYELYAAHPVGNGRKRWRAGSGAVFDLRSNRLRPAGWTSADAAGLPILPGLARYEEARRGVIDHALRFTVEQTGGYVYPARHLTGDANADLPPMGMRFRLKQSVNISRFPRQARIVLRALKRYGMIVADNGADWYISGAPSRGWNNDDLHSLQRITGRDFEVVDTHSLPHPGL